MINGLQLFPLVTAFSVAFILLIVMTPVAHQWGLVDYPSTRKHHQGLVPLTGGLSIFLAIFVASLATDIWFQNDPQYFTAAAFIVLLGMLDDRFDLSAKGRLFCQFSVAAIMVISAQNFIADLGNLFGAGSINLGWGGYFFTMICVVGVINAFNMIDGIDGLAGGMSLIVLICLVSLLLITSKTGAIMTPLVVIAAIVPFLAFNLSIRGFKGNKIFMGDSGSMFVGLTIAWLLVEYTQSNSPAMRPITAVWLIGLPLMDMAAIMYRRAKKGQSMLKADRQHLHNIFMRAGLSSKQALIAILLMGSVFAVFGVVGEILAIPEVIMFGLFIGTLLAYSYIIQNIWSVLRAIKSYRQEKQKSVI